MDNNNIYTQSDSGLNSFYAKIYGLVGVGIGLSAVVSYLMLYIFPQNMIAIMTNAPWVYYVAIFAELGLVVAASSVARTNSPMALPFFLIYSALNGFTMSFIIAMYTQTTVLQAFLSSSLLFFVMAIIGRVIKKDLSGMRKALIAGLIGIIIASLVNIFLASSAMSFIVSIATVIIFSGLIAYDNQLIKRVYDQTAGNVGDGWVVSMALSLYLDFINLFLSMLRIFGNRN